MKVSYGNWSDKIKVEKGSRHDDIQLAKVFVATLEYVFQKIDFIDLGL